ncbi:predicted protein [Nematostella vectensis]|uniref:Tartrate-resistant acid phosphatase type 5 n=1 Tax=Nematostella vectensis TaxID=45351 RepID=A7SBE6_NEMVE|nr:predicted protein [Nematostella vectensis]|eukprot:XP_001631075.1 predicted protein [Nematostella vectensis]
MHFLSPLLFLFTAFFGCTSSVSDSVRFLAVGDWGGLEFLPYKTPVESSVANRMGKVADTIHAQFVVALGDNFYFHGVKDVDDKRFQETYEDVFTAKSLMVPWYVCAGNHDHYGNASAEIAYSQRSKRWNFPDFYYTRSWNIPGTSQEVQLVLLDTVLLCGNTKADHVLDRPQSPSAAEAQWQWLEKTLKESQAHYLLVGGHFPVWSIAEHGPTRCLVDRLKPLLEKYRVNAYLSGHDHNLQHLKEANSTVEYFVIGAGAYVEDNTQHKPSVPKGSSLFYWANQWHYGGFATVQASTSSMNITFVDAEGSSLYSRSLYPRN